MKKAFYYFGTCIVLLVSFLYTEKAAITVKEMDEIMLKIKETSRIKIQEPIQSIIYGNTIIPGINGHEIDIEKSYRKMKYINKYSDNLLVYRVLQVDDLLSNNKDKVILSGNKNKNSVAIIVVLDDDNYTNSVHSFTLKDNISILVSGKFVEKNEAGVERLKKNIMGTIGYSFNYDNPSYIWLDNYIKKTSNTKNSYCLSVDKVAPVQCIKNGNYTIYGVPLKNNFLLQTKNTLEPGKILVYYANDKLIEEFDSILNFIHSKGYKILKLDKILQE